MRQSDFVLQLDRPVEIGEICILSPQEASGLRSQNTASRNIYMSMGDTAGKEEY